MQGVIWSQADDPCSAPVALPINNGCVYANYTNLNATATAGVPNPGCGNYTGGDVWFTAVVPVSGWLIFDMQAQPSGVTDGAMALYTGTCGALTLVACDAAGSANANMPSISQTGLTPGTTVFLRVWSEGSTPKGPFSLCARRGVPCNQQTTNATCQSFDIFCTGVSTDYCNTTGVTSLGGGGIYGCLGSTPNPSFYAFSAATGGTMNLQISQQTAAGDTLDVDYVIWGPFANQASICAGLSAATILSCSYSINAVENASINTVAGQWYMVLITNFSNQAGYINFTQTNSGQPGAGTTNCNGITVNTSACVSGLYNLTGTVIAPSSTTLSGTLTIATNCGTTPIVINLPASSPINYAINGLTGNGNLCQVSAVFSDPAAQPITPTQYAAPNCCVSTSANASCAQADPFCTGSNINVCNTTGVGSLGGGGIYGCLGSTPNPAFYAFSVQQAGPLEITLNQTSTAGNPIDVDFVVWGPFTDQASICGNLTAANIVDCSFSGLATEIVNIDNPPAGSWYMLLVTNYSNTSGTVNIFQSNASTPGAGVTNCNVLTATPSTCSNGQYSVSGFLYSQSPPSSGSVTITNSCNGQSLTFNAPFSTSLPYSFNNLCGNGQQCQITAVYSTGATPPTPATFTAPSCGNITAIPSACTGNTYSLTGNVTVACPPSSGTLTVTTSCGGSAVINTFPANGIIPYTISNITAGTQPCTVTAVFSATGAPIVPSITYTPPFCCTPSTVTVSVAPTSANFCTGGTPLALTGTTNAGTITSSYTNNTPVSIPDGLANNGLSPTAPSYSPSLINVSGYCVNAITAATVITVNLNINHTWTGDVVVWLQSPSGNLTRLFRNLGSSSLGFVNTSFSSIATNIIGSGTAGTANNTPPFTGTFAPTAGGTFTSFLGSSINGGWTLWVGDDVGIDVGTLLNWSITFATPPVYSWAPAAGLSSTNTLNTNASPTSTTTYTLTATNACGCSGSATSTITLVGGPTFGAPSATTACLNAPISPAITISTVGATGIGAATGLPAGVTATFSGNATAGTITLAGTPSASGTFNYSIPLTSGCVGINATGTLIIAAPPSVTANATTFNSVCAGPIAAEAATPTITLTLTPATATANWSLYAGTTATGAPIQTGTGNPNYAFTNSTCSNQSYVYRVIPTLNGCNGAPLDISITVKPKPLSTFTVSPNPVCIGQTATLTYTSPTCPTSSFNWESTLTPPNGYLANLGTAGLNPSATNAATVTVTPSVAGTYTIRVQSTVQSGCTGPMSPAIALVVAPLNTVTASTPRTVCQNQPLNPTIQFTTTGATGIGTATGLPAGIAPVFAGNATSGSITLSGTPTAAGTFNYSIPLTGGCGTVNATGTITVTAQPFANLTSSATICPGPNGQISISGSPNALVSWSSSATGAGIPFSLSPSGSANLGPSSLSLGATWPAGVVLSFTQVAVGGCTTPLNFSVTISSSINATVIPESPICSGTSSTLTFTGTPSATVTYNVGGAVSVVNLGPTGTTTANTASLTSSTTVTVTLVQIAGGCSQVLSNSVPITVSPANTAGTPSANPTLCINTALSPITIATTGATGISNAGVSGANGLPAGVSASWESNTITISGTPTAAGTFSYSIPLTGGCGTVNATGTITVNPLNTASAPSATPTLCPNTPLTPITIVTTGATGIGSVTGLPSGVSAAWNSNVITISGTPTVPGTYAYSIALIGGCGVVTATGSFTVSDILDFVNLQSPASGTICQNGSYNAYGQVYNVGDINTTLPGAAPGITAQIGYSASNTDPATWTNWSNASFNTQAGNNDEYIGTISGLAAGTYYYAFRYQINGCAWQYGGLGGAWNGTATSNSGVITVTAPPQAGLDGSVTLCATGSPVNLYSSLGALAATNGTWTGPSTLTGGNQGTFNPLTNTPGAYTYTVAASGCPDDVAVVIVTLTASPTASLAYPSPICKNETAPVSPSLIGAPGGNYSVTPSTGLSINLSTGVINAAASTIGSYTVTYNVAASNGCGAYSATASVSVIAAPAIPVLAPLPACESTTTYTASGGTWYEFLVNGISQGPASATATLNVGAGFAAGSEICVRSYPPPPIMDGALTDAAWGAEIAGSTGGAASSFGDNRIDGLKLLSRNGILYGAVAGTEQDGVIESLNNRIALFIDCRAGGFNNLGAWSSRSGANSNTSGLTNLNNGIVFDAGFEADYILTMNRYDGQTFYDLYDMVANTNNFLGSGPSAQFGFQQNASEGDLSKGFEFSFPLTALGNPTGPMKIFGMLVNDPGSATTTIGNQFITPANGGEGSYGQGAVFFNNAVPNPVLYQVTQDCFEQACVTVSPNVTPTFATPSAICQGDPAPTLPTSSTNVPPITGTWTGPGQAAGTYTFTPTAGQCANSTTLTVNSTPSNSAGSPSSNPTLCINTPLNPVITIATTGASGIGTPVGLPSGVTASWSNNLITITGIPTISGSFNYQIPLLGGCGAVNAAGSLIVNALSTPTFNPIGPLCFGATPVPPLSSISLNGITGVWNPTTISNTNSNIYTFTPNPNQCSGPTNLTVTIAPQVVLDGIFHD